MSPLPDPSPAQIITPSLPPLAGGGATAGSVPITRAYGRATAQTAAVASLATFTVGASDGTFEVSGNILVTASTTFAIALQVTYTDEGNTSRTISLAGTIPAGGYTTQITDVMGAVPLVHFVLTIRAKAATSITMKTAGTFTTVTYNTEALIKQVA